MPTYTAYRQVVTIRWGYIYILYIINISGEGGGGGGGGGATIWDDDHATSSASARVRGQLHSSRHLHTINN